MNLLELQNVFAVSVAGLILQASKLGYLITLGEAYRPPETAALYAKEGIGIVHSAHCSRLAIDVCLFKDTEYLTDIDSYRALGEYWKAQSTELVRTVWGGDFSKPDPDHFSVFHDGVS